MIVQGYKCEICGRLYDSELQEKQCENSDINYYIRIDKE
jgi:rubredoxin